MNEQNDSSEATESRPMLRQLTQGTEGAGARLCFTVWAQAPCRLRGEPSEQLCRNSECHPLHSSFQSSALKRRFPPSPPPLISPSICCYSFFNSVECLGCCLNRKYSQNEGCLLEIPFSWVWVVLANESLSVSAQRCVTEKLCHFKFRHNHIVVLRFCIFSIIIHSLPGWL